MNREKYFLWENKLNQQKKNFLTSSKKSLTFLFCFFKEVLIKKKMRQFLSTMQQGKKSVYSVSKEKGENEVWLYSV